MIKQGIISVFLIALTAFTAQAATPDGDANTKAKAFFEAAFDEDVAASPEYATALGLRSRYGEWSQLTEERREEDLARTRRQLQTLESTLDRAALDAQGRLSYDIFAMNAKRDIARDEWRYHRYPFDQMNGLQAQIPAFLINSHRVQSVSDAEAYISRLRGVASRIDQAMANADKAEKNGALPPAFVFPYVISDAANIIKGAPFDESGQDSPLWADINGKIAAIEADASTRARLLAEARVALLESVGPGYRALIEYARAAGKRAGTDDGVWRLRDGARYYDFLLASYTTTSMTAEEIHQLGLAEVARIHDEMRAIMKRVGFKGDLQAFFEFMRKDPQFYYPETAEGKAAYLAEATRLIDGMRERLPSLFRTLPKAPMIVKAVEPFREKSAGKAFYQRPSADGTRPGVYYANLYRMADMPKYEMEALAYHEGIPGHHMQLAIAGELDELPRFRRFGGFTAYSEGWGLYTERLPKELGLYSDPYSDFGRLVLELTRAVRLVVDTGLHAKRWTRERVIQYHLDNMPMTRDAATKATERYIVMPGQATAYTVGMLHIVKLREKSQRALGARFDIRDFHDVILRSGALPLDILEAQVDEWIRSKTEPRIPVQALDLYRLEQPVDPQLSPDGKRVAVLRETREIQSDRISTELWLIEVESGARHLLVGADKSPRSARWSPDGSKIAFIGREGSKPQIFILDVRDGRVRVLTRGAQAPNGISWSPDGSQLAFVMLVERKPKDFYELPKKPDGAQWAPEPRIVRDYPYRTDSGGWSAPGERHVFVVRVDGSLEPQQITRGSGDWGARDDAPAWMPDGQSLVVSADTDEAARRRANQSDLWQIFLSANSSPRQLTRDDGSEVSPAISPNGREVVYVGWRNRRNSHQRTDLFWMPIDTQTAKVAINLTSALDRVASQPQWREDASGVYFQYQDQGVNRVGFVTRDRAITRVVEAFGATRLLLPSSGGSAYSAAAGIFAYPSVEADRPAALAITDAKGARTLWDMNLAWREQRDIGKLEELWIKSSTDRRLVHAWVLYPPGFDPSKQYPLALDIHGGPHLDYGPMFSMTHHLYAAAGYVVAFANPRGSIGYGEEFASLINRAYPGKDHDDLMSVVDAVVAKGFIDTNRLYIGGGSGGGVLSSWAIGKTSRFAAASVKRPVINWASTALTTDIGATMAGYWFDRMPWEEPEKYWARSPLSLVGKVRTPTLIITGEHDWRTPMSDSEQYFQALQLQGVPSALMRLPEAGHGFGRPSQWLAAIQGTIGWYDSYRLNR